MPEVVSTESQVVEETGHTQSLGFTSSIPLPESVGALDLISKRHGHDGIQAVDVQRVADSDWLRVDKNLPRELLLRDHLINDHPELVHALSPEGRVGARELLTVTAKWLTTHHPSVFQLQGDRVINLATGDQIGLNTDSPLLATAKLVQEDLVLLHRDRDEEYRLSGGLLTFPSNWRLLDKLGLTIRETHQPVTLINDNIGIEIDRLLDRLKPNRVLGRVNLLVRVDSELPLIPDLYDPPDWPTPDPEIYRQTLHLRNERQTLLKLPDSGDIVFGIKIYITPLRELSPKVALRAKEILQDMPRRFLFEYKRWDRNRLEAVLSALELQAERFCSPSD